MTSLQITKFSAKINYSTYMAINNLYDIITNAIDRKPHTVGIFLDLSKVFDTLDHSIRGISNNWIKNYLKGRHQFVVYDKTCLKHEQLRRQIAKIRDVQNVSHLLLMGDFNFPEIVWINSRVKGSQESEPQRFYDLLK